MFAPAGRNFRSQVIATLCLVGLVGWRLSVPQLSRAEISEPYGYSSEQEFRLVPAGLLALQLAHSYIDVSSMRLYVDGHLWQPEVDYRLRARSGLIIPLRNWVTPAGEPDETQALVIIDYQFLPVPLSPRHDLWPVSPAPNMSAKNGATGLYSAPTATESWRTGDLQVSGSKTVQVSSGSRRELTVDQNLRLTIIGQLTPDIAVRAFLSDDNLPVVPEGNTEELRDIDKVLIELTAPTWGATLGDFVAERRGTTFGNYRRKLQGISIAGHPGRTDFEVLAGSPRGIYRTLQIRGQESNQGPYYLGGSSAAGNLFIVAGSERVTVDGKLLTRGADRDYVVDYILGTVTFTYRQLITAETTIVIEFEEGEGPYGRTVVGGGVGVRFRSPLLRVPGRVGMRIIRERDDPGRLRSGELGPEDEQILADAGDDPNLAVASGVVPVPTGEGEYDEQLSGAQTIYVFNGDGGDFDVSFFLAGPGEGDYDLDRLTSTGQKVFVYVGDGLGSYLIGRPLALPTQQSVATFSADLGDSLGHHFKAEWNLGVVDLNQLSELDNDDNEGSAGRVEAHLQDQSLSLAGISLGHASMSGSWEQRDAEFRSFQVHKSIFDYNEWGLDGRARQKDFLFEAETETHLTGSWRSREAGNRLLLKGSWGNLDHGNSLTADKAEARADWFLFGGRGRHLLQKAHATDNTDPLAIERIERDHQIDWQLGPVVPSIFHKFERWQDSKFVGPSAAGFAHERYGLGLSSQGQKTWAWNLNFARGLADSLVSGIWRRERDSRTTRAGMTSGRFVGMRLVGEGTLRETKTPDGPDQITRLGRLNLSANWQKIGSDWSLGYRVDNSQAEVLDRQIVFVGEGQGDFNEDGQYVGEGQGDYDVALVSTGNSLATTGVAADLNWRQNFKFLGAKRWYGAWSAMTLAAVEARNTSDDVGGLLALDPEVIFNKETAVLGDFNFSEELVFLQHVRTVDLRLKFTFRETVDRQFVTHPEDRTKRIWQLTGNVNVSRRSSLKLRWQRDDDRRYTGEGNQSARRSLLVLNRRYELGWNYTPKTDLRFGLQAEYILRNDDISGVKQDEIALRPTSRARLKKAWTLQADLRIAKVNSEEPLGALKPFFFPQPGTNIESSLRLAWDPSGFLSVSASWFSQKRGERRWQHDVRLETTARF